MRKSKRVKPTTEDLGAGPWLRLSRAIVQQAARDAKDGDPDALFWLLDPDALDFAETAGLDVRMILRHAEQWRVQQLQNEARRVLAEVMAQRQAPGQEAQCVSLF